MRETVEMIVKALVDDTEAVEVREVERGNSTLMIREKTSDDPVDAARCRR